MRYAVVLAAGRGERMWPLTSTRPKPLLPLTRGTLLSRILKSLKGIVDGAIVVVSPVFESQVRGYVEGYSWGYPVTVAVQEEARGTADAVRAGLSKLPRGVDEVLIVYGDLYYVANVPARLAEQGSPALAAAAVEDVSRYGLVLAESGCLKSIVEKPSVQGSGLANAGIYLLPVDRLWEALEKTPLSPRGEYEFTDTVTAIAKTSCIKVVEVSSSEWMDVATPWDLLDVLKKELDGLRGQVVEGEVEPGAVLKGPVYVAPKAVVRAGSVIEGPAWIEGEVGPLTHVRPYTVVLEGAKVGAFSQVKASLLMEKAKAPHLNYVGDSVVGEEANLGAGAITANLRFDHATIKVVLKGKRVDTGRRKLGAMIGGYAQIGINASLMPGIRVGAWSWVEPGITLYRDVPDCSFVRLKNGAIVIENLGRRGIDCNKFTPTRRY